jgi:hypothetical protein
MIALKLDLSNPLVQPSKPRQADGWIDPEGRFYACGFKHHSEFAASIGVNVYWLETHGWVHISGWEITNYKSDLRLSQPQQDTLFDMLVERQTGFLADSIKDWLGLED